jgi:hypothetical protein
MSSIDRGFAVDTRICQDHDVLRDAGPPTPTHRRGPRHEDSCSDKDVRVKIKHHMANFITRALAATRPPRH